MTLHNAPARLESDLPAIGLAAPSRTFKRTGTLPEELTNAPQWICWHYVSKGDEKPAKVPCTPKGGPLREWQKNSAQWLTYERAVKCYMANPALSGIGFVLTPDLGIVGVDMDHAMNLQTGEVAQWAIDHIRDFDSYTETSPSGAGFRMFALGTLPDGCPKKTGSREIYNGGRWLTVTGNTWNDAPIVARPDAIVRYISAMTRSKDASPSTIAPAAARHVEATPKIVSDLRSALAHLRADDRALWIKIGHCLHELGDVGRGLWLDWSQTSSAWHPSDAQKWVGFAADNAGYRGVFTAAQSAGWINPGSGTPNTPTCLQVAEPAPLRAVEVGDLRTATITPPQFVVGAILPRGHVIILGGHGGGGKTTLAATIAAHVAPGTPWAGLDVVQGRVLFVTLEDPAELVRWRLRAICDAYGLDAFAVARSLVIFDGTESDACALACEVFANGRTTVEPTASMRQLRDAANGADLIVIDNASDAFDGNENDRRQVRTFVRALAKIGRDNNAAVLLLAHIDKAAARYGSQGNSYSGSTAWHNSARSRLALVDSDGAIELRHEKANLCRKIDPIRLRFNDKGVMIPADASAAHGADDMLLLHCLHAAILRGDIIGTARVGAGTALAHARTLPHFPDGLKSSPRFWGALGRLEASGAIVREEYTNANRKVRQRWAIAPNAPNAPNTGLAQ